MGHHYWPVGQAVKTPPFHGGIGGSIPPPVTKLRALSSAGRASALQAECQRFDPVSAHHFFCPFCLNIVMARWFSWLECRPVTAEVVGSSPIRVANYASVAQLVEQRTENPCVHSSILC